MRGGLVASCTKMRVAKPTVMIISARAMGTVARWVNVRLPLCGRWFRGPQISHGGRGLLLRRVEPVVFYPVPVTLLDLGLHKVRPPYLLVELVAQRRVGQSPVDHYLALVEAQEIPALTPQIEGSDERRQHQCRCQSADEHPEVPSQLPAFCVRSRALAARPSTTVGLLPAM